MSEELIDETGGSKETPQIVKTLALLSIIGSSLWGLLLLIAMFYFLAFIDQMGRMLPIADAGGMMAVLIIVFLIFIGLNVLGLIGAIRMNKGQKNGYTMYVVATGIWALLMLLGATGEGNPALPIISAAASIGFIIAFSKHKDSLS